MSFPDFPAGYFTFSSVKIFVTEFLGSCSRFNRTDMQFDRKPDFITLRYNESGEC